MKGKAGQGKITSQLQQRKRPRKSILAVKTTSDRFLPSPLTPCPPPRADLKAKTIRTWDSYISLE